MEHDHEYLHEHHIAHLHTPQDVHTPEQAQEHEHLHEHTHPHDHDHAHEPGAHGHVHANTKAVINRLARAIGHLESVKKMVEDGRDCSEVLIQIAAVRVCQYCHDCITFFQESMFLFIRKARPFSLIQAFAGFALLHGDTSDRDCPCPFPEFPA